MIKMKIYITDEILTINKNIKKIADRLSTNKISTYGISVAEAVAELLYKAKNLLENEETAKEKVDEVIQNLPLLYLQISKIS